MKLPRVDRVERYAAHREALGKKDFTSALDALGVFIRLDERGGADEPAPWAFHGSGLPLPVDVPSSEGDDVFMDRPRAGPGDTTLTGPAFSLSIPAARGAATVLVLPHKDELVIGRDVRCDVRVVERSISKRHARIFVEDDVAITDIGSQNGTRVNGRQVPKAQRQPLLSGDVIDLGDVALLFLDVAGFYDGLPRLLSG